MSVSRRGFIGAATATAGVLATGGGLQALTQPAGAASATATEAEFDAFNETVFVHIKDAKTGEVAMLVGTEEIVFRDRALVARLIRASN